MNEYEVVILLALLRDNMKDQDDKAMVHNAFSDYVDLLIPKFKEKYGLFLE
ncbi:MAG: hypothetical protein ACTSSG_14855 [Candidatus Heimdallarchaeaceae archaeon]